MKPLSETLELLIEEIFEKKYGIAFAKIFCNWPKIVGTNLAITCAPITIYEFDKILVVNIYDKSRSIELHYMHEDIVERINLLLSSKNIALKILKLHIKKVYLN
jgi:hypothetical protein